MTHVYPRVIKEPPAYERKPLLRRVGEALLTFGRLLVRLFKTCAPKVNVGIGVNLFRINGG